MSRALATAVRTLRRSALRTRSGQALGAVNALSALMRVYGGTDKLAHGYVPHYERYLGPRRFERLLVFEIGVGGYASPTPGGSLAIWRDYLPRARVVGLDIENKVVELGHRVRFERADQADVRQLDDVIERHGVPDVVIDDGSHVGTDIRRSFEYLWPRMPPRALYVVEDLSTSYYPSFGGGDPAPMSSAVGLLQELVDSVQANDTTFQRFPAWGTRSDPAHADVDELHIHPGIAFVVKG